MLFNGLPNVSSPSYPPVGLPIPNLLSMLPCRVLRVIGVSTEPMGALSKTLDSSACLALCATCSGETILALASEIGGRFRHFSRLHPMICLLYTSDAAD